MGVAYNPRVVTDGLVLAYDIGNGIKNTTANISTNLIQNGNFSGGANSPNENGSNPTNTITQFPNPGDTAYVLRQNGNNTEYQLNVYSGMTASTTYVMSGWYAKSSDYNGGNTMFHARTFSSSGAHIATGTGTGTLIYSTVVDNITWEFRYTTISTPSDFNGTLNWYVGYGTNNTAGYRYYTNLRVEKGTYPSIFNLIGSGNHGECINGLSYSSADGGSLVFDGTNDRANSISNISFGNNASWEAWINRTSSVNSYNMFMGRYLPYFGARSGSTGFHFSNAISGQKNVYTTGITVQNNTWYCVAFTTEYDGSNTTMKIYVNGEFNNSGTFTGSQGEYAQGFSIGDGRDYASWYPFNGKVSNVKVYNRTLTASEIQQNFNATRGRFGIQV